MIRDRETVARGTEGHGDYPVSSDEVGAMVDTLMHLVIADVSLARAAPRHGLHLAPHQARAAMYLLRHDGVTVGELAEALGVSLGWASRIADELVVLGHVRRDRDDHDRRVVRLRLSPEMRAQGEGILQRRGQVMREALREVSPDERAVIAGFLKRLTASLEHVTAQEQEAQAQEMAQVGEHAVPAPVG